MCQYPVVRQTFRERGFVITQKFWKTDEFQRLNREWQEKLKEDGFVDHEDPSREHLRTWHSAYFQVKYTALTFESKQLYFERAAQLLHTHRFKSKEQKEIWKLHSQGLSLREIARALSSSPKGDKFRHLHKDAINRVIHELRKLLTDEDKKK